MGVYNAMTMSVMISGGNICARAEIDHREPGVITALIRIKNSIEIRFTRL